MSTGTACNLRDNTAVIPTYPQLVMSCIVIASESEFHFPLQIVPYPNIQSRLFYGLPARTKRCGNTCRNFLHLCSTLRSMINGTNPKRIRLRHPFVTLWRLGCLTLRAICTYPYTSRRLSILLLPITYDDRQHSSRLHSPHSLFRYIVWNERKRELFSIIKFTLWVKVYGRDSVENAPKVSGGEKH